MEADLLSGYAAYTTVSAVVVETRTAAGPAEVYTGGLTSPYLTSIGFPTL